MCAPQRIWLPQLPGEQKDEDKSPVAVIMRGIDNNKTTVCHLAIPTDVSRFLRHGAATAISLSQGGLKIPRHEELVARAIKDFAGENKTECRSRSND